MASQIPLPLQLPEKLGRDDFIVGPGNAAAVAFVDAWPDWTAPAGALIGPPGSGKSHLAGVWAARAKAEVVTAADLSEAVLACTAPLVIEDVGRAPLSLEAERALFALLERGQGVLLTAEDAPGVWTAALPDLISRFAAILAFPIWGPDDEMLQALAGKLFADRQLAVPEGAIAQMVRSLERSPAAIRDFVARADAAALARKARVSLALIRELLDGQNQAPSSQA